MNELSTTLQFLQDLRQRDIRLTLQEGRLRCSAPKGALTPELQAELSKRKAEIIAMLEQSGGTESSEVAIVPAARDGLLPVSFGQQRLWFLHQMEPSSPVYNIPLILGLKGVAVLDHVRKALAFLVRRHEVFRTTFAESGGQPVLVIASQGEIPLQVEDFRSIGREGAAAAYRQVATEELQRPFDLARGPLIRARAIWMGDDGCVLILVMHHVITDGWSLAVFKDEFDEAFKAAREGREPALTPLSLQYADYAAWQQEWLKGRVLEQQLAYWRAQLGGRLPVLQLPLDRPRPAIQTTRGAVQIFSFEPKLVEGVKAVANAEGATLFMILLATFKVLLMRYSGQEDILVGTSNGNRSRVELEKMLGFFVNTQVLRTDLSGDPTFQEALRRVRQVTLGAYAHQDVPFEKLVEELQPERDLSISPLFQVMFIIQNTPLEAHAKLVPVNAQYKEAAAQMTIEVGVAKFDLTLYVIETGAGLEGNIEYNTDLFDASTVARLVDGFERLLRSIASNPQRRLSELDLLSDVERGRLLVDWNNTVAPYPRQGGLASLLEGQVDRSPDAVAVVFEGATLTYRELDRRANQLAWHLRSLGVGPDVLVGICVERSLDMVVGLLGVLKAGGAYVPLDPAFPEDRLAYMLSDSQAKVVLTQSSLAGFVRGLSSDPLEILALDADWVRIAKQSDARPPGVIEPEDLAYVIYTSGSTGKPKGVQLPQGAVVNFLVSMAREPGLSSDDTLVAITTLSFDIAGLEIYLPLSVGARLVVASRAAASEGTELGRLLAASQATVLQATPATWRMLLESGWAGNPRLKALCGGEAMPRELADQLLARCGSLWNMYGPTETTIWSTVHQIRAGEPTLFIGRPIANTTLYILDPRMQPVPVGASGELWIGGDGLARGYLNRAELTTEQFRPDPFSAAPGQRMYRTGDLARYREQGVVECLGRVDHQVKIRGFRIELGEIETVLGQQPRIRQAVVVAREEAGGEKRLVAYLIADEPQLTVGDLRSGLKEKLPEYMVPSAFVFLSAFPLTPNGKVDRKALPAPVVDRAALNSAYEAPRNAAEEKIATIWRDVLRLDRVGVNDNFFDLGGHSLLLVRVHSQLRLAFAREIPIVEMFRHTTVAALAQFLTQEPEQTPQFDQVEERAQKLQASLSRRRAMAATESSSHE